jgi:hypothetical protein
MSVTTRLLIVATIPLFLAGCPGNQPEKTMTPETMTIQQKFDHYQLGDWIRDVDAYNYVIWHKSEFVHEGEKGKEQRKRFYAISEISSMYRNCTPDGEDLGNAYLDHACIDGLGKSEECTRYHKEDFCLSLQNPRFKHW